MIRPLSLVERNNESKKAWEVDREGECDEEAGA